MPNWCNSIIRVKGNPKDVENFAKLFIFEDEVGSESKEQTKYFARSFIHEDWKDFKKDNLGGNKAEFSVDFAWSCWSCLFEGYPNGKECVTLEWAMKKYNVEVEIETEEGGMGFEEKITTENKKPVYSSSKIPEHTCYKCGNKQQISSNYDLKEVECYDCEGYGFVDELTELIKEKIGKIENVEN